MASPKNICLLHCQLNFASGFRLEVMYIPSIIINIRSGFAHLCDFQLLVLLPQHTEITFFVYQQNKSSAPKLKFRQAHHCCKRVLLKLSILLIKKSISLPSSYNFLPIANNILNKGKSAIPPLFDTEVLSSENVSKNSYLGDSGVSLYFSPSRTNLKLHNTLVTLKLVKKIKTNLDSSNESSPDCIPVVVLQNFESKLSYILVALSNICLKESFFPDYQNVSSVVSNWY